MRAMTTRHGNGNDDRGSTASQRPARPVNVTSLSRVIMLMIVSLPLAYGGSAAKAGEGAVVAAAPSAAAPISLAGRWSGRHHSYSMRAPADETCGGKPCAITFDIVACGSQWCGIRVTDDKPCGDIAMRLKHDDKLPDRSSTFSGKLERAKGEAPFFVEAWYRAPGDGAGEGTEQARLNFVGDTGGEMLMMRRSYPFHAQMARTGEALCTLEKATS